MRCSNGTDRHGPRHAPCWLLAFALVLCSGGLEAAGFQVRHADVRLVDGVYRLDCDFDVSLSDAAREALENGVALTVAVDLEVVRERRMMWDQDVAELEARYRIQVHALSRQYLVKNENAEAVHSFHSLGDALRGLGTIRDFPLLDAALLERDEPHVLRLRVRLDIESLPAPLRPLAYLSPVWRLASDWTRWPIPR